LEVQQDHRIRPAEAAGPARGAGGLVRSPVRGQSLSLQELGQTQSKEAESADLEQLAARTPVEGTPGATEDREHAGLSLERIIGAEFYGGRPAPCWRATFHPGSFPPPRSSVKGCGWGKQATSCQG